MNADITEDGPEGPSSLHSLVIIIHTDSGDFRSVGL
jgi:hypothetical protein